MMPVSLLSGVRQFSPQTGLLLSLAPFCLLLILHIFYLVQSGSGLIFLEGFWWPWFGLDCMNMVMNQDHSTQDTILIFIVEKSADCCFDCARGTKKSNIEMINVLNEILLLSLICSFI